MFCFWADWVACAHVRRRKTEWQLQYCISIDPCENNDDNNDADITGFLLTAMKAIGLELKSSKGPIETIVIDHAEQPSPN